MRHERDVALLALLYRHAWQNRWESIDDIISEQENAAGELSWFSMLVAHQFTSHDWELMRALDEPSDFTVLARGEPDPLRAEALLHAAPPSGRRIKRKWAATFVTPSRWDRVVVFMDVFEREGLTATRDDIEAVAAGAVRAATGATLDGYLDEWAI